MCPCVYAQYIIPHYAVLFPAVRTISSDNRRPLAAMWPLNCYFLSAFWNEHFSALLPRQWVFKTIKHILYLKSFKCMHSYMLARYYPTQCGNGFRLQGMLIVSVWYCIPGPTQAPIGILRRLFWFDRIWDICSFNWTGPGELYFASNLKLLGISKRVLLYNNAVV